MDTFALCQLHQLANVFVNIHHEKICALTGAQNFHSLRSAWRMSNRRPTLHSDLGCGRQLAAKRSNDQEPHVSSFPLRPMSLTYPP